MATLQLIIDRAFREQQVLDIGETPSAAQTAEALPILQGILTRAVIQKPQTIVTLGTAPVTGIRARPRRFDDLTGTVALPQNVYVNCRLTGPKTILMPFNAGDGARVVIIDVAGNFATNSLTLDGNGSLVDGVLSSVLATNGQRADFMYRRDLAEWRSVSPLIASSTVPFPDEYDDMFVLLLAIRLMVRYGRELDQSSMGILNEMRTRFQDQYRRTTSDLEADALFESEWTTLDSSGAVDSAANYSLA